jgi:abortive infection bacteriophage resistance protein
VKYEKKALSFEQQADLLLDRGLSADRDQLIRRLRATSYFRLSGYLYPYRQPESDNYLPGTTLDQIWKLYSFDQRLRTLLLDAIEAIEVYVRTQLAYHFAHDYGPFAYNDPAHLPNLSRDKFVLWQSKLEQQVQRSHQSKEEYVVHFFAKYGDEHTRLPVWTLVELIDFGSTFTFFRGVNDDIKKRIAGDLGFPDAVVKSWLLTLNTIRNRCAHHSRLWNWELGNPVLLPTQRKFPSWHEPRLRNDRTGIILTICHQLMNRIFPSNHWQKRVFHLFDEFPDQPLDPIGLPTNWRDHPLWKS